MAPPAPPARPLPGLAVTGAIALAAWAGDHLERALVGHPVLDALVLAILLGIAVRAAWTPGTRFSPGIDLAGKQFLELAIVLLGASVDLQQVLRGGPALLGGIALTVVVVLVAGTWIGQRAGLEPVHATLVACGNAICGNSAIAALAPIIGARREQVASAIAFTAVIGVGVILLLPALIPLAGLDHYQYGVVAGLTVYSVPQVLAAAFPVSALSGEVGTLVKLVRVLMLGPVLVLFALLAGWRRHGAPAAARPTLGQVLPWFVGGFVALAALRSTGALPPALAAPLRLASQWLTLLAMAALGVGVDLRDLRRAGPPVVLTVVASLLVLVALAVTVARLALHP